MIQMLGSSDKDFKATIQKVLWQEIINSSEMNENIENLNKEKKSYFKKSQIESIKLNNTIIG